jgi:hypothetical protein
MRLAYLPTNAAWCVILGDRIDDASIVGLWDASGFIGRLFGTRREAIAALHLCGLTVEGSRIVNA